MSQITLNITDHLNTSLQNNDIVYYLGTDGLKKRIGPLLSKTNTGVTCDTTSNSDL